MFFQATSLEFLKIQSTCTGLKSVWNVQTKKGCKNPDGSEVHRKMHGCSTGGVEGGSPSRSVRAWRSFPGQDGSNGILPACTTCTMYVMY